MKRLLTCALAFAILSGGAALAQTYGPALDAEAAALSAEIDRDAQAGQLTADQAARLHVSLAAVQVVEARYVSAGGLSPFERQDLQQRLDTVRSSLTIALQANQTRR